MTKNRHPAPNRTLPLLSCPKPHTGDETNSIGLTSETSDPRVVVKPHRCTSVRRIARKQADKRSQKLRRDTSLVLRSMFGKVGGRLGVLNFRLRGDCSVARVEGRFQAFA